MAVVTHVTAAEEVRGTGAAIALLREVHRILQSEGAARISLGALSTNGRAINYYLKLGYRPQKAAYWLHLDWRHYGDYL
jgi:ribosomal protein S18 acetylase RimI-like enzyme